MSTAKKKKSLRRLKHQSKNGNQAQAKGGVSAAEAFARVYKKRLIFHD